MSTPLDDDQIRDYEITSVDAAALMIQGTRGYILATHAVPDLIAEVRRLHKEWAAAEAKVERVTDRLRSLATFVDVRGRLPDPIRDDYGRGIQWAVDEVRAALSGDA